MPTVETTVTSSISESGAELGELEAAVARVVEEAGRQLLRAACAEVEEQELRRLRGRVQQVKVRSLDMLTRFGWLRLERRQVVDRATGRYYCPLDEVLALKGKRHYSPWVQEQAVALATRIPYRQAARLLGAWLGVEIDHRTVHAWVQQAGQAVVEEEDAEQEAVFGDGEQPASDPGVREIVVTEVDGTFIKAQREEFPSFEVRVGVLFSGKKLESATARHRRYRLTERVLYGGIEPAEAFGERLFLAGEAKLGISHAQHLLLVGDGAEWIEALAGHQRWQATYQLDWWHVAHAIHRTFPDRPALVTEMKCALYEGEGGHLLALVSLARAAGDGDPERTAQLENYLRTNQEGFYGARRLRQRLSPEARLLPRKDRGRVRGHRKADGPGGRPPLPGSRHALDQKGGQPPAQTTHQRAGEGLS